MLAFGAGTHYAPLLISRYREELHRLGDRFWWPADPVAPHRAGPVTAS